MKRSVIKQPGIDFTANSKIHHQQIKEEHTMKFLSANQWALLEASSDKKGASLLDNNLLTISALYTRNLIAFKGTYGGSRRIVPTPLGKMYLKMRSQLSKVPSYREALDIARDQRIGLEATRKKVKRKTARRKAA